MNAREAIRMAIDMLGSPSPRLDCEIILAHTLKITRSSLAAHPELELGDKESDFFASIRRRAQGLPVAYVTGIKEFWGLRFRVTEDVLIPKPDTETLVEHAEEILRDLIPARGQTSATSQTPVRVLDVCTGSGCIAIALKRDFPGINMTATDISSAALAVARHNADELIPPNTNPIRFELGDLREGLPPTDMYDLIVSNPPYVPTATAHELLHDGRSEPILALDGGADGLDLVRALVDNVLASLAPGGRLLVETGEYNAGAAAEYMSERGFANVTIHRDLAGQDRVIEGTQK